jgi:hypothetical protein
MERAVITAMVMAAAIAIVGITAWIARMFAQELQPLIYHALAEAHVRMGL